MSDLRASKLVPDNHLILDQPFLRLPCELLRKNFKSAHVSIEKESTHVRTSLKSTTDALLADRASPDDVLRNVDGMLARMRALKRRLAANVEEETRLKRVSRKRIAHFAELEGMESLEDGKYEGWSRMRLDRLVLDYLLRNGHQKSAMALAAERGIEDLVDVETFVQMNAVKQSLREGRVNEALAWCQENKKDLKKMESKLEFMLRLQQYIELVRTHDQAKLLESIAHAKKYLLPYKDIYPKEVQQACGLLAFPPGTTAQPYGDMYSASRWSTLASLFMQAHNSLLSLPAVSQLNIALSAGLSALKTPTCHSSHLASISPNSSSSITTTVCPICSTELNDLARNVPCAHHTKSHVEADLVLLPNGNVYGTQRLGEYSRKAGLGDEEIKDLRNGDKFLWTDVKKVYIT